MNGNLNPLSSAVVALGLLVACGGARPSVDGSKRAATPSSATSFPTASPLPGPSSVTAGSAPGLLIVGDSPARVAKAPDGFIIGSLRPGVIVPFDHAERGWVRVLTPCENRAWIAIGSGHVEKKVMVVLDPGHGGDETGAVGPTGLAEKEVNLEVALRSAELIEKEGIRTLLTRASDYRATITFRVEVAVAVRPAALVSIHHNADPDGPLDRPGTETYYQYRSLESKRLAGLIYEKTVPALSAFGAQWVGDTDAGAKWRLNDRGDDYYGILRRAASAGITASLAELAFISNPSEEGLLRIQDVRDAEARAVAEGTIRFLRTQDPGSGFTVPYLRTKPAGPGGGRLGCVDPS